MKCKLGWLAAFRAGYVLTIAVWQATWAQLGTVYSKIDFFFHGGRGRGATDNFGDFDENVKGSPDREAIFIIS